MKQKKPILALIYDFDGTLSPGNMQEFDFLKSIGIKDKDKFWEQNSKMAKQNNASETLCWMRKMKEESPSINRQTFVDYGKNIPLYNGVKKWFEIINNYGEKNGITIQHYINSSGLAEMIEGTSIAKYFTKIYACSFMYDNDNIARWPAVAVDFTEKTQFLFMINKGVDSISDNKAINKAMPEDERSIPFNRMIYFGDGETDIPCMKIIKQQGGFAIAVYKPHNSRGKTIAKQLISDNRANFVCQADYSQNKEIYKIVTKIIDKIKSDYELNLIQKENERQYGELKK